MAVVNMRRKARNPGRRRSMGKRRTLTRKQILAGFGGKRRQSAAKSRRRSVSRATPKRRKTTAKATTRRNTGRATARRNAPKRKAVRRRRSPRQNIGEILSVIPISNSPRRNSMKRRTRRRTVRRRRAATHRPRSRRRNYGTARRNYGYRRRRRNTSRRRNTGRRRNPSMPASVGIIGGALLTSTVSGFATRFFPQAGVGPVKWVTTGLTAILVGQGVGKITRNRSLGNQITQGGMVLLALQVMGDLAPGLVGSLPIGLSGGRGVGQIAPSSFYSPQVPVPGSMTRFVTPAATQAAVARYAPVGNGVSGIGRGRYAR